MPQTSDLLCRIDNNEKATPLSGHSILGRIQSWNEITGEKEFFLSYVEIRVLAQYLLNNEVKARFILNRSHFGGKKFIHRLYFQKFIATNVSERAFVLI